MKTKSYFFLLVFVAFLATPVLISLVETEDEVIMLSIIEEENTNDTSLEFEENFEIYLHSHSFSDFRIASLSAADFNFEQLFLNRYPEPYCPPPQLI